MHIIVMDPPAVVNTVAERSLTTETMTREVRLGPPPPGPTFYLAEGRGREPLGLSRRHSRILTKKPTLMKLWPSYR